MSLHCRFRGTPEHGLFLLRAFGTFWTLTGPGGLLLMTHSRGLTVWPPTLHPLWCSVCSLAPPPPSRNITVVHLLGCVQREAMETQEPPG